MVKGKLVGLSLMDRGDGEGQASGLGAEGPKQWWRASKTTVDGLEVYVVVWVIHIIYGDQAKNSLFISSGLVSHPFNDQMECIFLCVPRDQSHIS
jgi:hypothetical protein